VPPRPVAPQAMRMEEHLAGRRYVVRAELPGVNPAKDMEVSVAKAILTIRAERHEDMQGQHRSEFRYRTFTRHLALPVTADANDIKATYHWGILEVSIGLHADDEDTAGRPHPHPHHRPLTAAQLASGCMLSAPAQQSAAGPTPFRDSTRRARRRRGDRATTARRSPHRPAGRRPPRQVASKRPAHSTTRKDPGSTTPPAPPGRTSRATGTLVHGTSLPGPDGLTLTEDPRQTRRNGSDPRTAQSRSARSGGGSSRHVLPRLPCTPADVHAPTTHASQSTQRPAQTSICPSHCLRLPGDAAPPAATRCRADCPRSGAASMPRPAIRLAPRTAAPRVDQEQDLSQKVTSAGAAMRAHRRLGWIRPLAAGERRRPYQVTAAGQDILAEQVTTMQQIVRVARLRTATARGAP
jgi:HSP20 family protein